MAWAAWQIYSAAATRPGWRSVYPGLAGYYRFWFKYHSSPRGLSQFYNAGADRRQRPALGPRLRAGNRQRAGGRDRIARPECASTWSRCTAWRRWPRSSGWPTEAADWQRHATELGQMIVDCMYFPDEAMFYDVKEGTHEKFSGVKNPNMFLPLWAGVPLAAEQVARVIERPHAEPGRVLPRAAVPQRVVRQPTLRPRRLLARPHLAARRLLDDPGALAARLPRGGRTDRGAADRDAAAHARGSTRTTTPPPARAGTPNATWASRTTTGPVPPSSSCCWSATKNRSSRSRARVTLKHEGCVSPSRSLRAPTPCPLHPSVTLLAGTSPNVPANQSHPRRSQLTTIEYNRVTSAHPPSALFRASSIGCSRLRHLDES